MFVCWVFSLQIANINPTSSTKTNMNFWIRTHWGPWWWLSAPQCRLLLCKPWSLQSPSPGGPLAADHDPWLCRGWGYTLWTNRASETGTAPSNIMTTFQWGQDQWSVRWMTLNTNHPSHSRSVGKQMLFSSFLLPCMPPVIHPSFPAEGILRPQGRKWAIILTQEVGYPFISLY